MDEFDRLLYEGSAQLPPELFFSPQQAFQLVYVALKKRNSLFKVTTCTTPTYYY